MMLFLVVSSKRQYLLILVAYLVIWVISHSEKICLDPVHSLRCKIQGKAGRLEWPRFLFTSGDSIALYIKA
jgi:hypothetical protein